MLQRAMLPDGVSEDEAPLGVPVGVEMVEPLVAAGMPRETAIRLQIELRRRGIWTAADLRRRRIGDEVFAALQSAYKTDVAAILNLIATSEV